MCSPCSNPNVLPLLLLEQGTRHQEPDRRAEEPKTLQPTTHNARVSVIIPVYNAEATVLETLDSVLAQAGVELEVIAVDDASADNSASILAETADRDPRVRVLTLAENVGQSAALNRGFAAASGDYIKFLDADDILSPGHLAAQLASLEGTERHLSACRWASFRESIDDVLPREEHTARDYADPRDWVLDSMEFDEGMMPGWRWLIPRAVLDAAGGWDERLSLNNDFEFSIRLLDHAEGIRLAPEAILYYRQGVAGTLSKRFSRPAAESAWLTTQLGCDRILEHTNNERSRRLCADRMQDWLFRLYPDHADLAKEAETRISDLGGSRRTIQGGRVLRTLARLFHWKIARTLQSRASRLGWNRVQNWKQHRQAST